MRIGVSFDLIKQSPKFFQSFSKKKDPINFFIYFGNNNRINVLKYLLKHGINYSPIIDGIEIKSYQEFKKIKALDFLFVKFEKFEEFEDENIFQVISDDYKKIKKNKKNIDPYLTLEEVKVIILEKD